MGEALCLTNYDEGRIDQEQAVQLNGPKSLTPLTLSSLILIVIARHVDINISDICKRVIAEKKDF